MKSKDYWAKRFNDQLNAENKKSEGYNKHIQDAYARASANIQKELDAWYARFADANGVSMIEARKLLTAGELAAFKMDVKEYIAKGRSIGSLPEGALKEQWIRELEQASTRVHVSRLEAMQIRMAQQAHLVAGTTDAELNKMAADIYTDSYYHTAFEVQKGVGVGFEFAQLPQAKIDKVLSAPWAADGKTFSDRVWANQVQLINELNNTFNLGIIQGKSLQSMSKALSERMGVSQSKAARLVATESAYFASAGQRDSFKSLGVQEYEVVATLDSHTSVVCQGLDGKVIAIKDFSPGSTAPPFHPNCRCTTVPHFDDEFTEDEMRAARDDKDGGYELVPSTMKYPEWKEQFVEQEIEVVVNGQSFVIDSGAHSGAITDKDDPWEIVRRAKANKLYSQYLARDKNSMIKNMASNSGMSYRDVQKVYEHVFEEVHLLNGEMKKFDADYDMAISFGRLMGKNPNAILPQDILLLKHERLERYLMVRYNMPYDKAHEITCRKYDFDAACTKYYKDKGWL